MHDEALANLVAAYTLLDAERSDIYSNLPHAESIALQATTTLRLPAGDPS